MQPNVHPIFAAVLQQAAELPVQVRRADYISRLIRMDWEYEHCDDEAVRRRWRGELINLRQLQVELDPTASHWNKYAQGVYRANRLARVECTLADGSRDTQWLTTAAFNVDIAAVMMERHGIGTRVEVHDVRYHNLGEAQQPMAAKEVAA